MGAEDEMCQLFLMYYNKDGRDATYIICLEEESNTVSAGIPKSSVFKPLPANPPYTSSASDES